MEPGGHFCSKSGSGAHQCRVTMVEPQACFPGCAHLGCLADSLAEPSENTELLNSSQATPWKPPREGQGHCPSPITGGWGGWRALRNPAFELRSPSDCSSHHAGPRGGQAGGAMQGGKELPTLHSRESLRHAPGMPSPSTPRPHLKDLGARLSKPVSTGNACSPFPAARLLSKLHCASAGGKPSFSPQQTRLGFLPSLVNVPEESQSWSLPVVTISCIWVRAHTDPCTITGTLQNPRWTSTQQRSCPKSMATFTLWPAPALGSQNTSPQLVWVLRRAGGAGGGAVSRPLSAA